MPRFAANLSMLYREVDFLARFAAAAEDGFQAVEFLFPYEHAPETIAGLLREHGLAQVLFNAPPGHWDAGERGLACIAGREAEFHAGIERALHYARELGCPRLHVMAGIVPAQAKDAHGTYVANLRQAATLAAAQGITLMIEPINARDMPGYFLQRQDQAHALLAEIGAANVQVQMDLYHCQISEGDLATRLRQYLRGGRVGHLQIAGVPGRHEPDVGEIHYPYLFALLDELGYQGWIGCEYLPLRGTREGLGWLRR